MEEHEPEQTDSESTETLEITAHIDSQTWFCLVDDDRVLHEHILEIEEQFGRADEERRVISELVPESEREESAPVIGTVEHADGELLNINIDLSDWYDDQ